MQPLIASDRYEQPRCYVAGLGFAVALLLIPALQWWWLPFFTQVDQVTELIGLPGGPDILAVPLATLLKYLGGALLVVTVLALSPRGPDQTVADPAPDPSGDSTR